MTNTEKARRSLDEATKLIREKPINSTLVERYFLLYEAWDEYAELHQPIIQGKGLFYVLEHASLPVKEYDLLLGRFDDHVPSVEEEARLQALWKKDPNENPIVTHNPGHITLLFDDVLKDGLPGTIEKCEARVKKAAEKDECEDARAFLEGMLLVYKAILMYIGRYANAAREAGNAECADVCSALTRRAPETFREALQLILFVYTVYIIYASKMVACLTLGRLDDILFPFYESDKARGVSDEELGAYIDDFSAKLSLHLGRGEHQMANLDGDYTNTGWTRNPVYDSPAYILIGGYSNVRDHQSNPLTLLFAKHIEPALKNPVCVCRYTKDTNEALWDVISKKVTENASVLLYNDETLIPAHLYAGAQHADAVNYSIHPCNWADMGGGSASLGVTGTDIPTFLNEVLHSNAEFSSVEGIIAALSDRYAAAIKKTADRYRDILKNGSSYGCVLSVADCFLGNPLRLAKGFRNGGVKYPVIYSCLRAIGTATDMVCAVKELVFDKKICTLSELVKIADNDFIGCEDIHKMCRKAPKYGTGNVVADDVAVSIMNSLLDAIDRETTNERGERDVYSMNVTINDSNHIYEGRNAPSTVDGRLRGTAFSENLSPTVGCAAGVTSLLGSVSKLPFERIHSGALNLRLSRSSVRGENAAAHIKALIKSYFMSGGMQLQFSIADTDELRRAKENPDEYRDLMVRITGYSAVFVDISKSGQEEFIRREEM